MGGQSARQPPNTGAEVQRLATFGRPAQGFGVSEQLCDFPFAGRKELFQLPLAALPTWLRKNDKERILLSKFVPVAP